jgi:hypothetical protein
MKDVTFAQFECYIYANYRSYLSKFRYFHYLSVYRVSIIQAPGLSTSTYKAILPLTLAGLFFPSIYSKGLLFFPYRV